MRERRQCARWPICQAVKYKISETNQRSKCRSTDLGLKGIKLELKEPLSSATPINLEIWLRNQGRVVATGKIVWQRRSDINSGALSAGVRFINITDTDKEKIYKYMLSNYRDKLVERWWQGVN